MTQHEDEEMFSLDDVDNEAFLFQELEAESGAAIIPLNFPLTDTGNAERMVAQFMHRARFCVPRKRWYTWDGRRWALDETKVIDRMALFAIRNIRNEIKGSMDEETQKAYIKWMKESESAGKRSAATKLAESTLPFPVVPSQLDSQPNLFNCANGTLDLSTGKLHQHDRSDLITKLSPVEYDHSARSDLWDSWLEQATGGDKQLQAYMARAVGYAMQGHVSERAFFFVYGPPGTSKSTFIDVIAAMFGDYHVSTYADTWVPQSQTGGNRPDLVNLLGARLATCSEFKKSARFDESLIKAITGGDMLSAAAKFENTIEFRPSCKVWFAANDAPSANDQDAAFLLRMKRIPFDAAIPVEKQDRTMKDRLREPEVLRAVMAWAVRGCIVWRDAGLGSCDAVDRSTAAYRKEIDQMGDFLEDSFVVDPYGHVDQKMIVSEYQTWAKANLVRSPLTARELCKRLEAAGFARGQRHGGVRIFRGLRERSLGDV